MNKGFLFICGCPRSGTTAFWELMIAHPAVVLGVERYVLLSYEKMRIRPSLFEESKFFKLETGETFYSNLNEFNRYYDLARERFADALWLGDKIPPLYQDYDGIEANFENAYILFIVRNIIDVAESYQRRASNPDDKTWSPTWDYRRAVHDWYTSILATMNLLDRPDRRTKLAIISYEELFLETADLGPIFDWLDLDIPESVRTKYDGLLRRSRQLDGQRGSDLNSSQRQYIALNAPFGLYRQIFEKRLILTTEAARYYPATPVTPRAGNTSSVEQKVLAAPPPFQVPRPLNLTGDLQTPGFLFRPFEVAPEPLTVWRVRNAELAFTPRTLGVFSGDLADEAIPVKDGWESAPPDARTADVEQLMGSYISLVPFKVRGNYCHFLLEGLTRALIGDLWADVRQSCAFIGDGIFASTTEDFVGLIFPGTRVHYIPLVGSCRVQDLIISGCLKHPMHFMHPVLLEELRKRAFDRVHYKGHFNGRVYIDRGSDRGIVNWEELHGLLKHYEFQMLRLEDMTAEEQINAFRSANVIVGVHGAGLANTIFCGDPKSASLIEIMPKAYGTPAYWILSARLGINYYLIPEKGGLFAESDGQRKRDPVNVDVDQLESVLRRVVRAN